MINLYLNFFLPQNSNIAGFWQRVQYLSQKYNAANIVLFSANQIADIFSFSVNLKYCCIQNRLSQHGPENC